MLDFGATKLLCVSLTAGLFFGGIAVLSALFCQTDTSRNGDFEIALRAGVIVGIWVAVLVAGMMGWSA